MGYYVSLDIHLTGLGTVFSHLSTCTVNVCVPQFTSSVCLGTSWGPQPENLCPPSAEGSSVITPSQTVKLLPRRDRWQMLEGLFIFCLLIRAVNRGGGAEAGEGRGEGGSEGRITGLTKRGTPCSGGNINFYLTATLHGWEFSAGGRSVKEARLCQRLSACRGMTQDDNRIIRELRCL